MLTGSVRRWSENSEELRWGRTFAGTALLLSLIFIASLAVTRYIGHMEREACFDRLVEEARDIADYVELSARKDREQLKVLATVVAGYPDLTLGELAALMGSFEDLGLMERLELLLPDDRVLTAEGKILNVRGILSFKEEAARGAHVTDRQNDLEDKDAYVLRHYVPVIRDGKTVAMLYGVIVIKDLPIVVNVTPYAGRGAMYIVDGRTGDFLIDTWHPGKMGNIWALGERETARGYDGPALMRGMMEGKSDYIVFVSRTVGEYLYFYYTPININAWRVAVSVPESVVFESSNTVARLLNALLVFEALCFGIYLLWMLRTVRRVTTAKQKRLEVIEHINAVERLLFSAHENREHLYAALDKLSSILDYVRLSFFILSGGDTVRLYVKEEGREVSERELLKSDPTLKMLCAYFEEGRELLLTYSAGELRRLFPHVDLSSVHSLLAVPIRDENSGTLMGILTFRNLPEDPAQLAFIRALTFSFARFCSNLRQRTALQERGDRDTLTGLYNRNRYERDLKDILSRYGDSLTCIYIDVNGLREMNNQRGHAEGDAMLSYVAGAIREHFATPLSYRTGGDEFVLFVPHGDPEILKSASLRLAQALAGKHYHVSVGMESDTRLDSLTALIKKAEARMYMEKQRYYATHERRVAQDGKRPEERYQPQL